eukprot:9467950-Pyramimonas_sp.AAC.1
MSDMAWLLTARIIGVTKIINIITPLSRIRMAIPAMATIIQLDGRAGLNSGSGTIAPRPPSGPGTDSYENIVVALRAGLEPPRILLIIRVR